MVETAAYLGARQINSNGDDPDPGRLAERFAALCCDGWRTWAARRDGIEATTQIRTVADATEVIARAAGDSNGVVTVDALHLARSGGCPDDVAKLDTRLDGVL